MLHNSNATNGEVQELQMRTRGPQVRVPHMRIHNPRPTADGAWVVQHLLLCRAIGQAMLATFQKYIPNTRHNTCIKSSAWWHTISYRREGFISNLEEDSYIINQN